MATALTEMPDEFVSGTTVKYTTTYADYRANDGWSMVLYVAGVGRITPITATASGASFAVTLTSSITAGLDAGTYQWTERVTKAGESYDAASGTVGVLANIATAIAGDLQSWEEKALVVVEAALLGRLTADQQAFSIAGRAVTKIPVAELLSIRTSLRSAIRSQRTPGKFGTSVDFNFSRPG